MNKFKLWRLQNPFICVHLIFLGLLFAILGFMILTQGCSTLPKHGHTVVYVGPGNIHDEDKDYIIRNRNMVGDQMFIYLMLRDVKFQEFYRTSPNIADGKKYNKNYSNFDAVAEYLEMLDFEEGRVE